MISTSDENKINYENLNEANFESENCENILKSSEIYKFVYSLYNGCNYYNKNDSDLGIANNYHLLEICDNLITLFSRFSV